MQGGLVCKHCQLVGIFIVTGATNGRFINGKHVLMVAALWRCFTGSVPRDVFVILTVLWLLTLTWHSAILGKMMPSHLAHIVFLN